MTSEDIAIVHVDTQHEDYLLAADIANGDTVWKSPRDVTHVDTRDLRRRDVRVSSSTFVRGGP